MLTCVPQVSGVGRSQPSSSRHLPAARAARPASVAPSTTEAHNGVPGDTPGSPYLRSPSPGTAQAGHAPWVPPGAGAGSTLVGLPSSDTAVVAACEPSTARCEGVRDGGSFVRHCTTTAVANITRTALEKPPIAPDYAGSSCRQVNRPDGGRVEERRGTCLPLMGINVN